MCCASSIGGRSPGQHGEVPLENAATASCDRAKSYAGKTVEVWERLDGELSVLYEGQEIATQEAPPRASVLRGSKGDDPYEDRARFMEQVEACLPAAPRRTKKKAIETRRPTPRMQAYWEAIHEAKRRGLSQRAIATDPTLTTPNKKRCCVGQ